MRIVAALSLLAACAAPRLGYVDRRAPGVQIIPGETAAARGMRGGLLWVDVDAGLSDDEAVAVFLRRAERARAGFASELTVRRGACAATVLPRARQIVHDEEVSEQVPETSTGWERRCERVWVPVTTTETVDSCQTDWASGTTTCVPETRWVSSTEWREECHDEAVTTTTYRTETHTEQVVETIWSLAIALPVCGGEPVETPRVEGLIYAAE